MASDNVSIFKPRARAVTDLSVGAAVVQVPMELHGEKHIVEIGVNLISAPIKVWKDDPQAKTKFAQALASAFTEPVTVRGKGDKTVKTVPLHEAVAKIIGSKIGGTQ